MREHWLLEAVDRAASISGFVVTLLLGIHQLAPGLLPLSVELLGALFSLLFAVLFARAGWRLRSSKPPPWPSSVWYVLFNRPPIERSEELRGPRIGLVHGSGSTELIDKVCRTPGCHFVEMNLAEMSPEDCANTLRSLTGLVLLHSKHWPDASSHPTVRQITTWARKNSERPVIAVLLDSEPLRDAISWACTISPSDPGHRWIEGMLGKLLARGGQRADAWRSHARRLWRVGAALALVLAISVWLLRKGG